MNGFGGKKYLTKERSDFVFLWLVQFEVRFRIIARLLLSMLVAGWFSGASHKRRLRAAQGVSCGQLGHEWHDEFNGS